MQRENVLYHHRCQKCINHCRWIIRWVLPEKHSMRNIFLLRRIFAYNVRWLDAALYTSVVTLFKVLSGRWISLFALGILLLPSIQFLSKLITSLHFSVQEIIDWALISLFYFLLSFGGSSVSLELQSQRVRPESQDDLNSDFCFLESTEDPPKESKK